MLNRGNKKVYIVLIGILFIKGLTSCKNNEYEKGEALYYNVSNSTVSKEVYGIVYKQMEDSIKKWCDNKLSKYAELWYYDYRLDSLLCFDNEKNKLVGALLLPCTKNNCKQDDLRFIYGIKIKGQWYFFDGATVVLPREYYQKDTNTPLSFERLHEIAMKEVFSGYLKKKDKGLSNLFGKTEWEINDQFFNYFDGMLADTRKSDSLYRNITYKTKEALLDSIAVYIVRSNWSQRDTSNIK